MKSKLRRLIRFETNDGSMELDGGNRTSKQGEAKREPKPTSQTNVDLVEIKRGFEESKLESTSNQGGANVTEYPKRKC